MLEAICVQIELYRFDSKICLHTVKYFQVNSGSFENNVTNKRFVYKSYIFKI